MPLKGKIFLTLLAVMLIAAMAAVIFQKEIRIAYHKGRLRTEMRLFTLNSPATTQATVPGASLFERLLLSFYGGNRQYDWQHMKTHSATLVDLGYLSEQAFPLHHCFYTSGTNIFVFNKLLEERFDFKKGWSPTNDWWEISSAQSNQIVVRATSSDMVKFRKLVEDFDRPEPPKVGDL